MIEIEPNQKFNLEAVQERWNNIPLEEKLEIAMQITGIRPEDLLNDNSAERTQWTGEDEF